MIKIFKIFAISVGSLVIIFFILGSIGTIMINSEKNKVINITETETTVYEEVTADSVIKLYEENELKADEILKDRRVIISGKIASIQKVLGQVYITLDDSNELSITQVQCYFDNEEASSLTSLITGQIVKIEGTIDGKGWNIDVRDCVLR